VLPAKQKALSKKLELGLRRALFISMNGLVSSEKSISSVDRLVGTALSRPELSDRQSQLIEATGEATSDL
jgi:hypothetical protein